MEAGDSSSGLDRPGIFESVPVGSSIGQVGVVASQTGDSQMIGVPGEAATVIQRGEQQHVATMAAAAVGPVGQMKKRGRPPKGQAPKPPPPKRIKEVQEEEDVCFICFDGGHLVLCDRKGCPKAYHPTCIKRDEAFFQSTSKWTCGWHICSVCMKAAHYKCYTCTYSLCKKCTKDAEYVCVRGNNGFCATCMKPIMLIENKGGLNKEMVDFDDRSSFEYLFKVYWDVLKDKLSLTVSELKQITNPVGGFVRADIKPQPLENSAENSTGDGSMPNLPKSAEDGSMPNLPKSYEHSEVKMVKEQLQLPDQNPLTTGDPSRDKSTTLDGSGDWASKELVEFVAHIKNGDTAVISQFDAQALLVEYIKANNLRDPRRKSQINCDERLKCLFGKPCVGHIEMLKLLEFHFPKKDDKKSFIPAGIVGNLANHVGADQHNSPVLNHAKRRKSRSRREDGTSQTNLDDYAAIDVHNINLIFLRRSMLENLFGEVENFHDKVVGSIVRIRVSTNDQKHDMFRLVQVVGTNKLSEPYKLGDKTADIMVEVLNLNKKETLPIDGISDQDFSEDECKRLRQSIKFGLVKRLKVGEIQMKSIALLAVKLDDELTAEILRLDNLRDRASVRKKELRECIEKMQILKTPEERRKRLSQIPEVHADPKMHPDYESEDDAAGEDEVSRLRYSNFNINRNQSVYPKRGVKDDEPISSQKLPEKSDGGRSNSCVKQDNHASAGSAGGSLSVGGSQTVLRSDPEPATLAFPAGEPESINITEMEKIWRYRDPNGKIQGPFSISQLRKWSTTGYFPTNMSIWNNNEQDRPILLSEALNGDFHNLSQSPQSMSMRSREVGNAVDKTVHVLCSVTASAGILDGDSTYQLKSVHEFDRAETRSHNHDCQSSQQNQGPVLLNLDLNDQDSNTASVTNPGKSSEQRGDLNLLDLPSPTPKTDSKNLECRSSERPESALEILRPAEVQSSVSIDIRSKDTGISDLQNPIQNSMDEDLQMPSSNPTVKGDPASHVCNPSDESQGGQLAVSEQPLPSKISTEDLGWNSGSGQVVGGGKMEGIANDWVGCYPTPQPCSREWEPGNISMSSLKLPEMVGNLVTAPISNQHPHSSPSHPAPTVSNWHSINEPIEFSTLAEESVSDLLAEYDAMESHSGLGSPTSAARCVDDMMDRNDCFSSIEDLSPVPDAGKNDALSSTADIPFPSLAAVMDDLFGTPDADAFDPLKMSGGQSTTSSEGETKSADATASPWEAGSDIHPPAACTMSQVMVSTNMAHGRGLETMDASWANVQGNMNLGCAGPPQNFVNIDWGSNPGTTWIDPNFNVGAYNGNVGWNSPRRYGGDRFAVSRDWPFQGGGDLGFGRGSRPTWGGRQSHGGGGGGYSSRPPSRAQRVCKFYESGHCKKGAACDYLHP